MKNLKYRKYGNPCLRHCLIIASLVLASIHIQAQSGAWKLIDSLPTQRGNMMNVCVVGSKIYFIGGSSGAPNYSDLAANEAYDPLTNKWEIKKSMPTPRGFPAAAVVNDTIYVIGGGFPTITGPKSTVEAYDPVTNTWITKAEMPIPKTEVQATVVNRKIYVMRGAFDTRNGLVYDPITNQWNEIKELSELPRASSLAVFNNLIYVFGGALGPTGPVFSTVNVYDTQTDSWEDKKKDMPTPRFAFQTLVYKGKIYAMGGTQGGTPGNGTSLSTLEVYDPVTDTWETKPDMPFSGAYLSGAVVNDKIYISQGTPDWATGGKYIWEYDPSADTTTTSVEGELTTPTEFVLSQNYPNPFNPTTSIEYRVASIERITLKIYDILGNEVATLVNEEKPAGTYEVTWNAANLPSGVYFYQLKAGSFTATKKLLLLK